MKIKLTEKYTLCSDSQCAWLSTEDAKGNLKRASGYHIELDDLLSTLLRKRLLASETETIEGLIADIAETRKDIKDIASALMLICGDKSARDMMKE